MKVWQLFENFKLSELNANFAELLTGVNTVKASYLTANKTVYVATTGSDTTGTGTSGNPYKTIAKGLSVIPKNLNGCDATLFIAGGTYSESVIVKGYIGGMLNIVLLGNVSVNSLVVDTVQFVLIQASTAATLTIDNTTASPIIVRYTSKLRIYMNVTVVISTTVNFPGIYCHSLSQLDIDGIAIVYNADCAVRILMNSKVFINDFRGSGNNVGIYGGGGSIISYDTKTISATNEKLLSGGSIITNLITMP